MNPSRRGSEEFPPMVDEVHAHMKEMLEVGAICPSQTPWCNTSSIPEPRKTLSTSLNTGNHRKSG